MSLWQWVSTLAAGFIGSWLGGWIGVRSHRSQRSFELRVAWYQEAINKLNIVSDHLVSARNASERGEEAESGRKIADAMRTVSAELVPEIVRGKIFGTPSTIRAIDRFIESFRQMKVDESPWFTKDDTGFYDRTESRMLELRHILVDDCRSVMAYERQPIVKVNRAE